MQSVEKVEQNLSLATLYYDLPSYLFNTYSINLFHASPKIRMNIGNERYYNLLSSNHPYNSWCSTFFNCLFLYKLKFKNCLSNTNQESVREMTNPNMCMVILIYFIIKYSPNKEI